MDLDLSKCAKKLYTVIMVAAIMLGVPMNYLCCVKETSVQQSWPLKRMVLPSLVTLIQPRLLMFFKVPLSL
ncbi:hypothetical protein COLO4_08958 [Corchorus olitorius]|uniref:Uncharacterized protein n=1 Tax=Corchorus olitorius TaxID=93759 RepID=A0A1R3KDU8_9ROSI|nr:hypothetical protein COLO4_08958 [Corchorus olitorius]